MPELSILKSEIELIQRLSSQRYPKSLKGLINPEDELALKKLQEKLKRISDKIKYQYDEYYGPFISERSKGNPVNIGGALRRVWSGVYKGASNKQYAAQISLVINMEAGGLDIGFYFGRTSAMRLSNDQREYLECQLKQLGKLLYDQIENNTIIKTAFNNLIDLGFLAETKNRRVTPSVWLREINESPSHSSLTITIKPDDSGIIPFSLIDIYVALVMPLMVAFPKNRSIDKTEINKLPKPLTPEQRAKQAEMRALIGIKGEELVLAFEKQRLLEAKISRNNRPSHQSLISDAFHYDILSCDEEEDNLYIEVKTTTRQKKDIYSSVFYMSNQEYKFFQENIKNYRIYRVYDVYGNPEIEVLDIKDIKLEVDTYRINIKN